MTEPKRKLYRTECDVYSAESPVQVLEMLAKDYGGEPSDFEQDVELLAINHEQCVTFYDGAENDRAYPAWVDTEPAACVEWTGRRGDIARVRAQAWVWAKHESGMIATENY